MWRLYLFGLFIIAFLFVLVFAIVEDNYNQKKEFEKGFADGARNVLEKKSGKMIKIKKHGNPLFEKTYETTCPYCGCEFSFQLSDTRHSNVNRFHDTVDCPDCGYELDDVWKIL